MAVYKHDVPDVKNCIAYVQRALDLDPSYGLAYAVLADCYYDLSTVYLPPQEAMSKARAAAR